MAEIINLLQPLNVTFPNGAAAPMVQGQDCSIRVSYAHPKEGEQPFVLVEVDEGGRTVRKQKLSLGNTCTIQLTRSMRHFMQDGPKGKPIRID